jgi:N-acetylmuramoyl-L-alanine amidase
LVMVMILITIAITLFNPALPQVDDVSLKDATLIGNIIENELATQTNVEVHNLNDADLELLYQIVWAESGNCYNNMLATTSVIMNRVNSKYFPNTITEVVYQGNGSQFNAIWRKEFGYRSEVAIVAVHQALQEPMFSPDVVYFANISRSTDRRFIDNVIIPNAVDEIGGHTFARDPRGW